MKKTIVTIAGALLCACNALWAAEKTSRDTLWYAAPAPMPKLSMPWEENATEQGGPGAWESQTLPVGNGRIGATGYGGVERDCLVLNEVSLWSGGPNEGGNGRGYDYGPRGGKNTFGSYQPFGHLVVQFEGIGKIEGYKRVLDIGEGVLSTEFTETEGGKSQHRRECFVSQPDDVMVYRAKATGKKRLNAKVALLPFHDVKLSRCGENGLRMSGTLQNGEAFEGRIVVLAQGGAVALQGADKDISVQYKGGGREQHAVYRVQGAPFISISGAESFTIIVSLATDYKMDYAAGWKGKAPSARNEKTLKAIAGKPYAEIRHDHVVNHRSLYDRMSLNLGSTDPQLAALPTNERLKRYRAGASDPELEALVYKYGRYVLIAGSRPGNLPVNLQGIWNNMVHAPWACDYHNNINLQMCYWGAEVANLSECHLPLIDFISAMQEPLSEMTRKQYGAGVRGWTSRISQNPWGGGGWVKWNPPVNAWYALHVWEHFLFTQDMKYLKDIAYPILKNVCFFWEDTLKTVGAKGEGLMSNNKPLSVKDHPELADIKDGALVAPMGWSHEWGPEEDGCAHDQQLVWELFDITAAAARLLGEDADFAKQLTEKKKRLVGNRIAPGGYLQEWIVDRPNMVSGHRHTSHLIGVYPGSTISLTRTPELAKAAMKSLDLRGLSNDNRRSWTWPWRTALRARFHDGEQAYEMVKNYLRYNVLDNLFGNHPPMQMDGTYGMTGGMSEMLVQSHAGQIELLPALPQAWKNGSVRGLRARGNITIDMKWKNGKVTNLRLTTSTPNPKPVSVVINGEKLTRTPAYVPAEDGKALP